MRTTTRTISSGVAASPSSASTLLGRLARLLRLMSRNTRKVKKSVSTMAIKLLSVTDNLGSKARLGHCKIFTALATTRPTIIKEVVDCKSINIFAHFVRGMISVGLKALAFVNDMYR